MAVTMTFEEPIGDSEYIGNPAWNNTRFKNIFPALNKKIKHMGNYEKMKIVNPYAAGIDIGSKSHFVAIGQGKNDVQEFGVYSKDYQLMIGHLNKNRITTIAMESTGSYWQTLF